MRGIVGVFPRLDDTVDAIHALKKARLGEVTVYSPTPRHETVQQALRLGAGTALVEIDAALDRMATGRFGRCVSCGRQIPSDRLDVLPMTALCMSCHFTAQNSRLPDGA